MPLPLVRVGAMRAQTLSAVLRAGPARTGVFAGHAAQVAGRAGRAGVAPPMSRLHHLLSARAPAALPRAGNRIAGPAVQVRPPASHRHAHGLVAAI